MSYVTGSADNITNLLAAIRAACTDNGWTLSGEVLHKGAAYIRTQIVSGYITWLGGTGIDGSNNLTGAAPQIVRNGDFGSQPLTFPCTYEVHINEDPDEVYVVLNYATEFYQYAAFGLSDVAGLPGTGMWFAASRFGANATANGAGWHFFTSANGNTFTGATRGGPMFYASSSGQNCQTSYIHHGLDGRGWSGHSAAADYPQSFQANAPLLSLLPNTWNDETVLLLQEKHSYAKWCPEWAR
jgi:hypothetical protein